MLRPGARPLKVANVFFLLTGNRGACLHQLCAFMSLLCNTQLVFCTGCVLSCFAWTRG